MFSTNYGHPVLSFRKKHECSPLHISNQKTPCPLYMYCFLSSRRKLFVKHTISPYQSLFSFGIHENDCRHYTRALLLRWVLYGSSISTLTSHTAMQPKLSRIQTALDHELNDSGNETLASTAKSPSVHAMRSQKPFDVLVCSLSLSICILPVLSPLSYRVKGITMSEYII